MTTAIYARVSTKDGRQTVENQLGVLRKEALKLGGEIVEYVDLASGSKADRVELLRMLTDAECGRINTILIWALDRLTREGISALCNYLERMKRAGVRVVSIQEPWLDTAGPISDLLVAIFGWVAAQERVRIRDRIVVGLERARSEGTVLGRPPTYCPDDAVRLRASGKTLRQIATLTGISKSAVANMLQKRAA